MTEAEALAAAERALALGREGRGRAQIAAALGLSQAELRAAEAAHPGLAQALERAHAAAQGWWEALPRQAVLEGARFNVSAWLAAARWLRGDGEEAPGGAGQRGAVGAAGRPGPAPIRVRYEIPDNGKEGPRMPEGYYDNRDDRWWRDETIREVEADLLREAASLKQQRRYLRDEEREVAELTARLAWLRTAPLGETAPEWFLPDDADEDGDEDGDEEDDDDRLD